MILVLFTVFMLASCVAALAGTWRVFGIGLAFLPVIFYPILGFGDAHCYGAMAMQPGPQRDYSASIDLRRLPADTSPEIYHRLNAAAIRLFRCIVREAPGASPDWPYPDRFQQLLWTRFLMALWLRRCW